jgi:O-antigen ligase
MNNLRTYLPLAFLCSFIVSLFFYETAKAWLSVSMFGIIASVVLLRSPLLVLQRYIHTRSLFVLSLSCVFLLLYIGLSDNVAYAWNRIEIKAPLLGLAIAFASIGKIEKKYYDFLLALYVMLCLAISCYTIFNYANSYELVTESYLRAKVMPTILNHVRYSIMVAMGSYIAYYLFKHKYRIGMFGSRFFLGVSLLLFIFLHVYSVRSGLLAMYGMIAVELILVVRQTRNYKAFAGVVLFVVLMLGLSLTYIPTLRNKWVNTVEDMSIFIEKGYPNYNSLTTRFISYEGAISIFRESPVLGCGLGDIKDEMDAFFKASYPMIDIPILPHNQFLFYLAATGMLGLFLFCLTFYFPLFYRRNFRNRILLMQYIVLTLSFMTEPMLETQLGMAYAVLFILLPLSQSEEMISEPEETSTF